MILKGSWLIIKEHALLNHFQKRICYACLHYCEIHKETVNIKKKVDITMEQKIACIFILLLIAQGSQGNHLNIIQKYLI